MQPWHLVFDTTRKHFYLDTLCVAVDGPEGLLQRQQWLKYRLGRILAEGITLLPDKFGAVEPKRPRYRLEYLLAPADRAAGADHPAFRPHRGARARCRWLGAGDGDHG